MSMRTIDDTLLKKYADIAKLYEDMGAETDQGGQSVSISANDLLAIIERLEEAERMVEVFVKNKLKEFK
jgi:hypothetical protein